jgi:hypothetical protein
MSAYRASRANTLSFHNAVLTPAITKVTDATGTMGNSAKSESLNLSWSFQGLTLCKSSHTSSQAAHCAQILHISADGLPAVSVDPEKKARR